MSNNKNPTAKVSSDQASSNIVSDELPKMIKRWPSKDLGGRWIKEIQGKINSNDDDAEKVVCDLIQDLIISGMSTDELIDQLTTKLGSYDMAEDLVMEAVRRSEAEAFTKVVDKWREERRKKQDEEVKQKLNEIEQNKRSTSKGSKPRKICSVGLGEDVQLYTIKHLQSGTRVRRHLKIQNPRLYKVFERNKELGKDALYMLNTPKCQVQRPVGPEEYCNCEDVSKILAIWEQATMDLSQVERHIRTREEKKKKEVESWGESVEHYQDLEKSDASMAALLQKISQRLTALEEKLDSESERQRQQKCVDDNFEAFQFLLPDLIKKGEEGKWALMRNKEMVGLYPYANVALSTGRAKYSDGLFSIQEVTQKPISILRNKKQSEKTSENPSD